MPTEFAILVDEAHDFDASWLRLVVSCLNPATCSLFVVHDSAQNIYRRGFSFKSVGIQIQGRTKLMRINYRNTRQIAELASAFLNRGVPFAEEGARDDEGQLLEIVRPQATMRSGPPPTLVRCESFREECAETAARVKLWIERGVYAPADIALLYVKRGATPSDERYIGAVLTAWRPASPPSRSPATGSRSARSRSTLRRSRS